MSFTLGVSTETDHSVCLASWSQGVLLPRREMLVAYTYPPGASGLIGQNILWVSGGGSFGYAGAASDSLGGVWLVGYNGDVSYLASDATGSVFGSALGDIFIGCAICNGNPYFITAAGQVFTVSGSSVVSATGFGEPVSAVSSDGTKLYTLLPASDDLGTETFSSLVSGSVSKVSVPITFPSCLSASASGVAVGGWSNSSIASGASSFSFNSSFGAVATNTSANRLFALTGTEPSWSITQAVSGTGAPVFAQWAANGEQVLVSDATNGKVQVFSVISGNLNPGQVLTGITGASQIAVSPDSTTAAVVQPSQNQVTILQNSVNVWNLNTTLNLPGASCVYTIPTGGFIVGGTNTLNWITFVNAKWIVSHVLQVPTFSPTAVGVDSVGNILAAGTDGSGHGFFSTANLVTILATSANWTGSADTIYYEQGQVLVADSSSNLVRVFGWIPGSAQITSHGTTSSTAAPNCKFIGFTNPSVWLCGSTSMAQMVFTSPFSLSPQVNGSLGVYSNSAWSVANLGSLNWPTAVTWDVSGHVWAATTQDNLYEYNTSASLITSGFVTPIAASPEAVLVPNGVSSLLWWDGGLYASSSLNQALMLISGAVSTAGGSPPPPTPPPPPPPPPPGPPPPPAPPPPPPSDQVQNLTVYDVTPSSTGALVTWNAPATWANGTDLPAVYKLEVSQNSGTTYTTFRDDIWGTTELVTGLTAGSTTTFIRVTPTKSSGTVGQPISIGPISLPAVTSNFKIAKDSGVVLSNAAVGSVICNFKTNLTSLGTVTWNVSTTGSIFFDWVTTGTNLSISTASPGGNGTLQVTLQAAVPSSMIGTYAPFVVTASAGTTTWTETHWIFVQNSSATIASATTIGLSSNYSPSANTIVIPSNFPVLWPLGFVSSTGPAAEGGTGIANYWIETPASSSSNFLFGIESNGEMFDGCQLILLNPPAAGTYSVTVKVVMPVSNANAQGTMIPTALNFTVVVLPPASTSVISWTPNTIDNGDVPGTALGTPTVSNMSAPLWAMCPRPDDKANQFAISHSTGAISTAGWALSYGTDTVLLIAYNGTNPSVNVATYGIFQIPVRWQTPTTTDPAVVSGAVTVGAGQTYENLSHFMNVALGNQAWPNKPTTKNAYGGITIKMKAGTYTDDWTVEGKTGTFAWANVPPMPCKVIGDLAASGLSIFKCDFWGMVGDGVTYAPSSEEAMFNPRYFDLKLRNLGFIGFEGTGMYGVRPESMQRPHRTVVDNCFFSSNDDCFLGGGAGQRVNFSNSVFAYGGQSDRGGLTTGQAHNVYFDTNDFVSVDNCLGYASNMGHIWKDRSVMSCIRNTKGYDGNEGTGSFCDNIPSGGVHWRIGNKYHKGPNANNVTMMFVGAETDVNSRRIHKLTVDSCLFINGWKAYGNNVAPSAVGIQEQGSTGAFQGRQIVITLKNNQFAHFSDLTQRWITTGTLNESGSTSVARLTLGYGSPFTNGATLPAAPGHLVSVNYPQSQPDLQENLVLGDKLQLAHNAVSGTVICTPQMLTQWGSNIGVGAMQSTASGVTTIPVAGLIPVNWIPQGATISSYSGATRNAPGIPANDPITAMSNTNGTLTVQNATTAAMLWAANFQFTPTPFNKNGFTLSWTDDHNGAATISAGKVVGTGQALSAGDVIMGVITATPIGTVTLGDGSTLKPLVKRCEILVT